MTAAFVRPLVIAAGLLVLWHVVVLASGAPPYILPGPLRVLETLGTRIGELLPHAGITALEILLGLALGTVLGGASALVIASFRPARRWLMPVLVVSQALPVFALAPILTLWLGYGLASKVAMATLIIYFPVTSAFHDGLRRVPPGWVELARSMGGSKGAILRHIRLPAAMPAFGSGLRVAAAVAPIGAVVGEWVGSSRGLGYLMLHANARLQIDMMFAALLLLAAISLTVFYLVDWSLKRALHWRLEG